MTDLIIAEDDCESIISQIDYFLFKFFSLEFFIFQGVSLSTRFLISFL